MCPLRYILLFLSLIVAMIGLSQAMNEPEQLSYEPQEEEEDEHEERLARKEQTTLRTLVDMLNGKYLYDAWKASSMRVKTA